MNRPGMRFKTMTEAPLVTGGLQHKSLPVTGFKIVDDTLGIVECYVSGIGNKDSVGDIIQPGAFVDSLRKRTPKGVWSHDWTIPVSKTLEVHEVAAGDPRLPEKMKQAGIGGLYVKTQFNLETQRGREAYSDVKFYGDESEWSIGYMVTEERYSKDLGANLLIKIELYEYSPVLFGANPLTATVGVKVAIDAATGNSTVEVTGVDDTELATKVAEAVEALVNKKGKAATEGEGGQAAAKDGEGEVERKVVPGSMEARYRAISKALSERYPNAYAFPVATFSDSVVYEVYSYNDATEEGTFRCSYSIDGDVVTLGDAEPVDVVEVVVAKAALAQAEGRGIKLDEMATAAKSALDLLEEKAGRVLSSKNLDRLNQVKSLVDEILSSADAKDEDADEKAQEAIAALMEKWANNEISLEEFQVAVAAIEGKAATTDAHQYQQGDDGTCTVCNMKEDDAKANHTGDPRKGGSDTGAEGDASKGGGGVEDKDAKPEELKKAIASHSTDTSDKAWDGPAQKTNLPNESAALRKAFAWVDPDGDADTKSSYKFIHHFVDSDGKAGAASTTACSTGIGVLNGGRGGTKIPSEDKKGVYNHLAKHLKDAGQEPPELKTVDPDGTEHVHKFTEAGDDQKATCGEHFKTEAGEVEHCAKAPEHDGDHGPVDADAEGEGEGEDGKKDGIHILPAQAKAHSFDSDGAVLCDTCEKDEEHWIHKQVDAIQEPTAVKLGLVLVALSDAGDDLGEKAEDIVRVSGDLDVKLTELVKEAADADVTALVQAIDGAVDELMDMLGIEDPDDGDDGGEKAEMVVLNPLDILALEMALSEEALRE